MEPKGEEGATSSMFSSSSESVWDLNPGFSTGRSGDEVLGFFLDDDLGKVRSRIEESGICMND